MKCEKNQHQRYRVKSKIKSKKNKKNKRTKKTTKVRNIRKSRKVRKSRKNKMKGAGVGSSCEASNQGDDIQPPTSRQSRKNPDRVVHPHRHDVTYMTPVKAKSL